MRWFTPHVYRAPHLRFLIVVLTAACDNSGPTDTVIACNGEVVFDNEQWTLTRQDGGHPEVPFQVVVDGKECGEAKVLAFGSRVAGTSKRPLVMVVASSGFIRLKAGADPPDPLPFGQSLVLGPSFWGTTTARKTSTLYYNPQLHQVEVRTTRLEPDGTGALEIIVTADFTTMQEDSMKTNRLMSLSWEIVLYEPSDDQSDIDVSGHFEFHDDLTLDSMRTDKQGAARLLQISSMFIDAERHDVSDLRFEDDTGHIELMLTAEPVEVLLPIVPREFNPATLTVEVNHSDDIGEPNGNTPSYLIDNLMTDDFFVGNVVPRAYIDSTSDVNDDNLGIFLHQAIDGLKIPHGGSGNIAYSVTATTDPQSSSISRRRASVILPHR